MVLRGKERWGLAAGIVAEPVTALRSGLTREVLIDPILGEILDGLPTFAAHWISTGRAIQDPTAV